MTKGASKPETFADEGVNDSGSLSGVEPSAAEKSPALSAFPTKGVLRKRVGGDNDSDGGSDDEELTESKPPSATSDDMPPKIAAKEAQRVLASKILVAFVLMLSAGLLGYFSYAMTRDEEESEFESKVS
jgi:hypothetical protein